MTPMTPMTPMTFHNKRLYKSFHYKEFMQDLSYFLSFFDYSGSSAAMTLVTLVPHGTKNKRRINYYWY